MTAAPTIDPSESESCLASVETWREALSALNDDVGDAARIDGLRALEELKCAAEAAQAKLAADLDRSMRAEAALAGIPKERQGRGVSAQVGLARRVSGFRGERLLNIATVVIREMPCTFAAWQQGLITERRVTALLRETAMLDLAHRQHIDRELAGDGVRLSGMGDREAEGAAAKLAAELDPAGVAERRRNAEKDRHTSLRPAPDTMTRFSALLGVKDGVSIHAVLGVEADRLRASGDERTRGQIMADTLVDRVLQRSRGTASAPDPTKWDQAAGTVFGAPSGAATSGDLDKVDRRDDEPGVMVNLIVSDEVLLGGKDGAGYVMGYGAVPGNLLREWIADRLEADGTEADSPRVWLRRLYETPEHGELVGMDSTARLFSGKLAAFLRFRDRACRMPYCDAPGRHLDHVEEHADGGKTRAVNGQGLCAAHNYAKEALGWSARPRPGPRHTVETTTPTDHTYTSEAPAAGGRSRLPEIRVDWRYIG